MVRFDVEVAYTLALAAQERARVSRRTADDADSLLMMARARRDAGDASELDVLLATMAAGQLANSALSDWSGRHLRHPRGPTADGAIARGGQHRAE